MTIREKRGKSKAALETNGKPKEEKKPKAKKPSKDDRQSMINEKIEELVKSRSEYLASALEWDEAHARAGELKKTMERKQAALNQIVADIDAIRNGNYTPPLPFGQDAPTGEPQPVPSTLRADGPWKDVELSAIGINGKIIESLHEADLKTIGDLHNFTATNKRLSDIAGIGPGKAGKIEDALLKFWSEYTEPVVEAEKTEEPVKEPGPIPF